MFYEIATLELRLWGAKKAMYGLLYEFREPARGGQHHPPGKKPCLRAKRYHLW